MTKHLSKFALAIMTIFFSATFFMVPSTYAESYFTGRCEDILGLKSWDCNVNVEAVSDESTLTNVTITIAANVFNDIIIIAQYLVLGYVIYGGYLYSFSGGDPGKVANGKKTLTQAFIGFAIVMLSYVILNTIRIIFLGANGAFDTANCATADSATCVSPTTMVSSIIQWVIGVAGLVSLIFVVYGGISYATSSGDPNRLQKAKGMITYAIIGLAIVALAEIITAFVSNIISSSA